MSQSLPLSQILSITPSPGKAKIQVTLSTCLGSINDFLAQGRYFQAIYILEQLCDLVEPRQVLDLKLLNLYIDYKRFDKGKDLSEKLVSERGGEKEVLRTTSRLYQSVNEIQYAVELLERAIEIDPGDWQSHRLVTRLYQSLGEREKAIESIQHSLDINPAAALSWYDYCRLERGKDSETKRRAIGKLLDKGGYNQLGECLIHFAIAETCGEDEAALQFKHLNEANRLAGELNGSWDEATQVRICRNNKKTFNRGSIRKLGDLGDESFNPVFIAAMPRSGSTLLEQMLGAHSHLTAVGENAPFENALYQSDHNGNPIALAMMNGDLIEDLEDPKKAINELAETYKSQYLIAMAGEKRIVDKTIGNYFMAGIILTTFPNARLIHLQRHPLDLIYSCYQQFFGTGHTYSTDLKNLARCYKIYQQEITHWKEVFPEKILTVYYEKLITNQENVLREILNFCGLPWEQSCLDYQDSIGMINTASDLQVRGKLHSNSVGRWKNVEPYLKDAIDELGDAIHYEFDL